MKAINNQDAGKKTQCPRFLRYKCIIVILIFIYPYLVGFSSDSTSTAGTVVELLLGAGRHSNVAYDCNDNPIHAINYSTEEYGISVSHHNDDFNFGVKTGGYLIDILEEKNYSGYYTNYYNGYDNQVQSHRKGVFYVTPFLGGETNSFAFLAGISVFTEEAFNVNNGLVMKSPIGNFLIGDGSIHPAWYLRIGNRQKFYFSTQYLNNVPLFSGGGIGDIGFGFGSEVSRNLTWIGASIGPYQNMGISLKQDIQASEKFDILLRGRAGVIEDNFEGGFSAGLRILF